MVNLVLPDDADGGLAAALYTLLSKRFRVARERDAEAEAFDFVLTEHTFCQNAAGWILLCGQSGRLPEACPPHTVGVLRSDCLAAARSLGRLGIPAVSCGMAVTDTLTFSSVTPETAVVCLQRSIPLLGGGEVEPGEIPLSRKIRCGDYALMCAVAALLLTGGWELLSEAAF